jgi:hypothetical protein
MRYVITVFISTEHEYLSQKPPNVSIYHSSLHISSQTLFTFKNRICKYVEVQTAPDNASTTNFFRFGTLRNKSTIQCQSGPNSFKSFHRGNIFINWGNIT